jgi:hypothetical protein
LDNINETIQQKINALKAVNQDTTKLEEFIVSKDKSEYFQDGQPIDKKDIEGLPEEKEEKIEVPDPDEEPTNRGQAGLANKVVIRTYAEDSILAVRIDGEEYVF